MKGWERPFRRRRFSQSTPLALKFGQHFMSISILALTKRVLNNSSIKPLNVRVLGFAVGCLV
jgi:hypothetical protein